MNNQDVYEIDLLALWGKCLLHWKKIAVIAIAIAVAVMAFSFVTFEAPVDDCAEYRKIEAAIADRTRAEEELAQAQKRFDENQYYSMDPEQLMYKQLTINVELADQSKITDQLDPTDSVLYAYNNMARVQLREQLVPSVVSELQWEQLVNINYNTGLNTVTATMSADDEVLIDTVMAAAAQWYTDHQADVISQTEEHKLTTLPIATTIYTREDAEAMVNTAAAEEEIAELQEALYTSNNTLKGLLNIPGENATMEMTEDELNAKFEEKKLNESEPGKAKPLLLGGILGGVLMVCWYCLPGLLKGELLGENAVADITGWRRIGRIKGVKKTADPFIKWGYSLLYRDYKAEEEQLQSEVSELTALLLKDQDIAYGSKLGLVGAVSAEDLQKVAELLKNTGMKIESAELLADPVAANQLCREADAVIFVGEMNKVRNKEVRAMSEILEPLKKKPTGYVLV